MDNICTLLFKQIHKPKNIEFCKAVNVYDNKYRINVYSKTYDSNLGIEKKRITHSYFAKFNDEKLEILV